MNDLKLVKHLQLLGLTDGVINVLLDYVAIFSRIGMVHPLMREMGVNWHKENILTVEKAIVFVREEHKEVQRVISEIVISRVSLLEILFQLTDALV